MLPKRILVPLGRSAKDLKSVHYALSLAERLQAQVYILQEAAVTGFENPRSVWLDEALLDLINSARQAGLTVSHHIADGELRGEIIWMARAEGVDVLIFGEEEEIDERFLAQLKPLVAGQIIRVKERDNISYV
jgi:hypothetical protein